MVPSWAEWTLPQDSKSGQRDAGMDFFLGGGGMVGTYSSQWPNLSSWLVALMAASALHCSWEHTQTALPRHPHTSVWPAGREWK